MCLFVCSYFHSLSCPRCIWPLSSVLPDYAVFSFCSNACTNFHCKHFKSRCWYSRRGGRREAQRVREDRKRVGRGRWWWGGYGGWLSFFRLQGRCFSKSAWGYTPAPRLPEAFRLPPNSQPPSVSHGQMMGRFPLLCPALFFLSPFFFPECTSTQVRMAELPGNSQKPLAFGTICPAAFLLSLIRKEWGWMQSTSSPSDVTRLCKLGLLYSFSSSSPSFPSAVCSSPCTFFICFLFFSASFILR